MDQKENFETIKAQMNEDYSKSDNASEKEKRVYGIWFEEEYKRYYPYNETASTVLGFSSSDGTTGNGGIEQSYNSVLVGTNGREYGYLNDDSNLETVIKPAVNGNTVVSTIDLNVQQIVEKYVNEWMTTTGSENIDVVVMDPDTGEILAMATDRMYDLNNPRDLSGMYTDAEIAAMSDEEQMDAWYKQWRNFCVSDTYEPGSPSKIFTIAAALEEGVIKFIGSTTENPYFSVNNAIISRVRNIYEFRRLETGEILGILKRTLEDTEKGFGGLQIKYDEDALRILADMSGGDCRVALDTLGFIVDNLSEGMTLDRKIVVKLCSSRPLFTIKKKTSTISFRHFRNP